MIDSQQEERALIGAMLNDFTLYQRCVRGVLEVSHFGNVHHRAIFQAIVDIWRMNKHVTVFTVAGRLPDLRRIGADSIEEYLDRCRGIARAVLSDPRFIVSGAAGLAHTIAGRAHPAAPENERAGAGFWMVWGGSRGVPTVRHPSREVASTEAERLARANPGSRFYTLAAAEVFVFPPSDIVREKLVHADEDEVPF